MLDRTTNNISIILAGRLACVMTVGAAMTSLPAAANDFTAAKVMNELKSGERYVFVAGVVEGLAVARYMKDGKKSDGMNCIYDWFYGDKATVETIYSAFGQYGTYPPGSVVDVLAKQKCGE